MNFGGATLKGVETVDQDPGEVVIDSSGYSATFDGPGGKNVGLDKPVTVLGVDLDGTEATNYTVSQPTGLAADISAKNLTINGALAVDRDYDGTDVATVNFGGATLQGVERLTRIRVRLLSTARVTRRRSMARVGRTSVWTSR